MVVEDNEPVWHAARRTLTPIEGDCITAPVTKARVIGDGIIHG